MRQGLLAGVAVVAFCVVHADAQPITLIGGKSARFTDREGTAHDKATIKFSKDPQMFTLLDPRCPAVSSLRLTSDLQDTGVINLQCGNWQTLGSGFRYKDPSGAAGGVQKIIYKSGSLAITIKGPGYNALHGVVAGVEARFSVGPTRYCGRFQTFRRNTTSTISAIGPTAACQPICGDGFVDPGEQCDDSNTANGDCCSSTCQFETGACSDGNLCTVNDHCSNGVCVSTSVRPWINEFDYDDFTGLLDDRDEFVEIAAPAGTDLGGYKVLAIEGNLNGNTASDGSPCLTDFTGGVTTGNAYFTAVIPPGTIVTDNTGTGIGYLVACFTNTSTNHESAGECDVVLPAPSTSSNLKNGYLVNTNQVDCPDGILFLDPYDNLVDALSYEGQVPNMGLYGSFFQTPSYSVGTDQGWVAGVSIEKRSSTLGRALSSSEWHPSGGCTVAAPTEDPQETTLVGNIGAADATLTVASVTPAPPFYPSFPTAGTIRIDAELAAYTGLSGNTLTGVARGINGTAPAAHAAGAVVGLVTGCQRHSDSPGRTNPGQLLTCVAGTCGNGTVNVAAGEECDPNAVPTGCGPTRACVPAGQPNECTCSLLCGNGTIDPGEECDPVAASACAGGVPCNSDCTCPPPPTCTPIAYTITQSSLDLCTALTAACPPPAAIPLAPPSEQTTFQLCFSSPDTAGRLAITIDPNTYYADAGYTPAGPTSPIAITTRNCQTVPGSGTLYTMAAASSYPSKRCLVGNPASLLRSCLQNSECDGPTPITGNGICGTRDVDYTSVTTAAGTTFSIGDGMPDPAGSILMSHPVDVQVFFNDQRCTGTGADLNCVACDGATPVAAGRVGVLKTAFPPPLILPLNILWSTATVENAVSESGNLIDGRQVSGAGVVHDTTAGGMYELAAANARLNVTTPFPFTAQVQFFTKELRAPVP